MAVRAHLLQFGSGFVYSSWAISAAARDAPPAAFVCRTAHGLALVLVGEGDLGAETIRDAAVILASAPELARDPSLLHWTVLGALWLRERPAQTK